MYRALSGATTPSVAVSRALSPILLGWSIAGRLKPPTNGAVRPVDSNFRKEGCDNASVELTC